MIKKVKDCLKAMPKEEIKNKMKHPDFTGTERWLIYYTFGEKRMVINTCYKLGLSEAQFYITKNIALTKFYYIYLA